MSNPDFFYLGQMSECLNCYNYESKGNIVIKLLFVTCIGDYETEKKVPIVEQKETGHITTLTSRSDSSYLLTNRRPPYGSCEIQE